MKLTLAILFSGLVAFAVEVGQDIELLRYVNARHSARFTKNDKNIMGQLLKGTHGKVLEVKKFNSGNSGVLIQVQDGKMQGESVWVHFDPKSPSLLLKTKTGEETKAPDQASKAQTTRDVSVIREPASPQAAVVTMDRTNTALGRLASDVCDICDVSSSPPGQSGGVTVIPKGISTSRSALGDLSAQVNCSHKSEYNLAFPGTISLKMEGNQVKFLDAKIDGCSISTPDFKQVDVGNKNIVLKDSNGCTVVVNESQNTRGQAVAPILQFGVIGHLCHQRCPRISQKFWQVEMNPRTQTCY